MTRSVSGTPDLAMVVIGRNEGVRLVERLNSIRYIGGKIVYVDFGMEGQKLPGNMLIWSSS